jgi:hypothetical protein
VLMKPRRAAGGKRNRAAGAAACRIRAAKGTKRGDGTDRAFRRKDANGRDARQEGFGPLRLRP